MEDIVERLLDQVEPTGHGMCQNCDGALRDEAAEEIKRLRAGFQEILDLRSPQDLAVLSDAWEIAEKTLGRMVTKQTVAERYAINR